MTEIKKTVVKTFTIFESDLTYLKENGIKIKGALSEYVEIIKKRKDLSPRVQELEDQVTKLMDKIHKVGSKNIEYTKILEELRAKGLLKDVGK